MIFQAFRKRAQQQKVGPVLLRVINRQASQSIFTLGKRLETRSNLCLVAAVIPMLDSVPWLDDAFAAISKDFCSQGLSIIVRGLPRYEQLIVGLPDAESLAFLRGSVVHRHEMGGGFWQLGIEFQEVVHPDDYPGLSTLTL